MNRAIGVSATLFVAAWVTMTGYADDGVSVSPTVTPTRSTVLDRIDVTQHDRAKAGLWGLSTEEWQRYRTLMAGIRGSISPETLSPIEVLGIHARDDAERRKYAEQWVVLMHEDAERVLAFQRAYDEAGRLLFPQETLIDITRMSDRADGRDALQSTDRVMLFVRPDCAVCNGLLARALARLDRLDGVDIFLSGIIAGDEDAIRTWASERGIRPEWVTARRVTLNFDGGALERVGSGQTELPVVMRRRGESVTRLASDAL